MSLNGKAPGNKIEAVQQKRKFDTFELTDLYSKNNQKNEILAEMKKYPCLDNPKVMTEEFVESLDLLEEYRNALEVGLAKQFGIKFDVLHQVSNPNNLNRSQLWDDIATRVGKSLLGKELANWFKIPGSDEFVNAAKVAEHIKSNEKGLYPSIGSIIKFFVYGNDEIRRNFRYLDEAKENLDNIKQSIDSHLKKNGFIQNDEGQWEAIFDEEEIIFQDVINKIEAAIDDGKLNKLSSIEILIAQCKYKNRPLRDAFGSREIFDIAASKLKDNLTDLLKSKSFAEQNGAWSIKRKRVNKTDANNSSLPQLQPQTTSTQDISHAKPAADLNDLPDTIGANTAIVQIDPGIIDEDDDIIFPELLPFDKITPAKKPKNIDSTEYEQMNVELVMELKRLKFELYKLIKDFIITYPRTSDILNLSVLIDDDKKTINNLSKSSQREIISNLLRATTITTRNNEINYNKQLILEATKKGGSIDLPTIDELPDFEKKYNQIKLKFRKNLRDVDRLGKEVIEKNIGLIHWALEKKSLKTDLSQGPINPNIRIFNTNVTYGDLIQNACMITYNEFLEYDPGCDYKLSTRLINGIRWKTPAYLAEHAYGISIPESVYYLYLKINRKWVEIYKANPSWKNKQILNELLTQVKISKDKYITKEQYFYIMNTCNCITKMISLDNYFYEPDFEDDHRDEMTPTSPKKQYTQPKSDDNVDANLELTLLRDDLYSVLGTLTPRERDILTLRHGLDDGREKTLREIGIIFDVTHERIRQVEAKGLRKLRHPNRNSVLKEYLR